jgi:rsbT co-antagonist protein RsbR
MLPLVGVIDSARSQLVMESMLDEIQATNARVTIIDIMGVAAVDSAVANHLVKISQAVRLMGCEGIVSGMSPAVAQTIVQLAIPLGNMITTVTLKDALVRALDILGLEVTLKDKSRPASV